MQSSTEEFDVTIFTKENHVNLEDEKCGYLSKLRDSGKTFFDISVYTDQIEMGFEADTPKKTAIYPY